jgi:hypothetical protein
MPRFDRLPQESDAPGRNDQTWRNRRYDEGAGTKRAMLGIAWRSLMLTEEERPHAEGNYQSAAPIWTELDQVLEPLTPEPKSESAVATKLPDEVEVLPAPHDDPDYDISEGGAECADSHDITANTPAANSANVRTHSLAASAVLLVAVAAASISMAYLAWWPEDDTASAARLKQDSIVASAALFDDGPLDMKAIPGQADALSEARTARATPVRAVGWNAEPHDDVTLGDAADAPWRSRPSAAPDGEAQASKTAPEKPAAMNVPAAPDTVEKSAGAHLPQAVTKTTDIPAEGSTTVRIDAHGIRTMLARADSMVQSGDVASARLLFQQAADTGDAYAAGTSYGSAVISRLPALMMVLNDAAATPDALGSPEEAAVPAQVRPRQHPVSSDQAILSPPKEGKERRPGKSEIQPRARADVARAGPVTTARRFVRTVADRITRRFGP